MILDIECTFIFLNFCAKEKMSLSSRAVVDEAQNNVINSIDFFSGEA